MDELRWHVVHETNDGVGEQRCAFEEEDGEQSPKDGLWKVHARLASRLLWVALEGPGRGSSRSFRVEDSGEARWQLVLVLHRHLLVVLLVVCLESSGRGRWNRGLAVFTAGDSAWVHVAVDLCLEVFVERDGVARCGALITLHVHGRWAGCAALGSGHVGC